MKHPLIPRYLTICLLVGTTILRAQKAAADVEHPEPITYESILAWHKAGGLDAYHWPKEHNADLNDDKTDEVFLGLSGYGRGMIYALFTKTKEGWRLLSDEIDGSHHNPIPLPATHEGWHDLEVLSPTGRGGLHERVYTWDGKKYILKATREISKQEPTK